VQHGEVNLTMTGDVLGTLRYMSPEQALVKRAFIDHRTDVYSLGVTLYELLTLEPPFAGHDRQELLNQIAFDEPCPPRRLNRAIPVELETILLKALAKEPSGRYATAQELADDLRRYLEHKPIRARRPALADRLAKWGRRHRPLVHAGAVFLVLAVGGLTAGIVRIAQEQAETAKARDLTVAREQSLRQMLYVQDIVLAWQALREGERERMRGLLDRHIPEDGQEDLRSFEWFYLQQRSHGLLHEAAGVAAHEGGAYCVTYSPDGRTLASAGKDSVIRFWDARTLRPQGELRSGQFGVNQVVFSPDGKSLASAGDDGTVWLWGPATAKSRRILRPHCLRGEMTALALSPDGKWLAAGGREGRLCSWDFASGRLNADQNPGAGSINYLTFAPDGRFLAVANYSGRVLLLDPATLQERGQLQHPHGPVPCVSFSHDGKTLAVGSAWGGQIVLWDLKLRVQRLPLRGHEGQVQSLSFSPDDALLVSVGDDGRVKLWDVRSGGLRDTVQGHIGRAWCTTFAPDGERLATAGQDGSVKLWHVLSDERRTLRVATDAKDLIAVGWVAFSPDGQTLFAGKIWTGELGRWSTLSGQRQEPAGDPAGPIALAALAPASRLTTVALNKRDLRVQDLSGAAVQMYRHTQPISTVAISSDGERVAFADDSPAVWMWEVGPGQPQELLRLSSISKCLAFAPDGRTIAVADAARVLLLNTAPGESLAALSGHEKEVRFIAFSPDGRLLATSALDGTIRVWEFSSGRQRYCLWMPGTGSNAIAFSPDGKTLASGGGAGAVILWNGARGQELMRLEDQKGVIHALAFSPDGKILAAGGHGSDPKMAEVTLWYTDGARPNQGP
jgi:WD40 repeat protein